jgi:hypothetical protein
MSDTDRNVLTIDVFKDKEFFGNLSKHNKEIKSTILEIIEDFDFAGGHRWANPDTQHLNPLSRSYPLIDKIQWEERWNLILNLVNYPSLFVINELYKDKKDILIEDVCSGIGYFVFYLNKLGFNNFSLVDNFIELPSCSIQYVMKKWNLNYILNDINAKPIVVNQCGFPYYPRQIKHNIHYFENEHMSTYKKDQHTPYFGEQIELFCSYQRSGLPSQVIGNLIPVAVDKDEILGVYCREDKYDEFYKLLEPYKI